MIKFLDIVRRYEAAEFGQLEAAGVLRIGERTFRRWRQRFEDAGEPGLRDRRLGKASGKRVPADCEAQVEALYKTRYAGFTATHFHAHLARDRAFAWGYTWTKTFLHSKGLALAAAPADAWHDAASALRRAQEDRGTNGSAARGRSI